MRGSVPTQQPRLLLPDLQCQGLLAQWCPDIRAESRGQLGPELATLMAYMLDFSKRTLFLKKSCLVSPKEMEAALWRLTLGAEAQRVQPPSLLLSQPHSWGSRSQI